MELKQYKKCNNCKALTYRASSSMGRCDLGYKTISESMIYDTKPLEPCPKPKTNDKYREVSQCLEAVNVRGAGRPHKPTGPDKTRSIRVNDHDWQTIAQKAKEANLSITQYILSKAL